MHDSLTTTEKIYGQLTRDQMRQEIAALTQPDQPIADPSLDAIIRGFSENPEILVDPLADAFVRRLSTAPNSFVQILAKATAQCIRAERSAGAP
jgi:hypothetical protein